MKLLLGICFRELFSCVWDANHLVWRLEKLEIHCREPSWCGPPPTSLWAALRRLRQPGSTKVGLGTSWKTRAWSMLMNSGSWEGPKMRLLTSFGNNCILVSYMCFETRHLIKVLAQNTARLFCEILRMHLIENIYDIAFRTKKLMHFRSL